MLCVTQDFLCAVVSSRPDDGLGSGSECLGWQWGRRAMATSGHVVPTWREADASTLSPWQLKKLVRHRARARSDSIRQNLLEQVKSLADSPGATRVGHMVHAEVQTAGLAFTEPNWDAYSEDGDHINCFVLDALQEDVAALQKLLGTHPSPDVTDASSGLGCSCARHLVHQLRDTGRQLWHGN